MEEPKGHLEESFFWKVYGTLLPESFRKRVLPDDPLVIPEEFSGTTHSRNFLEEPLLPETIRKNHFFRKFEFFLKNIVLFFLMNELVILFL